MPKFSLPTKRVDWLTTRLGSGEPLSPVIPDDAVCPRTGSDNAAAVQKLVAADPLGGDIERFPGLAIDPDAVVLGSLVLAASIERQTEDGDRKQRMRRAVAAKLVQLREALELDEIGPYRLLGDFCSDWTAAQKTTLLIELAALDPFDPFQIEWVDDHRDAGLAAIAEVVGLDAMDAQRVLDTFVDAARAHRDVSMLRVGLYTVAGAAAVGSVGLLAAPMLGSALGAATGLSGAAATSHGLALIGGMGGTGSVTAGTWLVAQAGAVAGAVGASTGSALFQLGAAQAQAELIKLQVAAKLVLVDLQRNDAAAHQIAEELKQRLVEVEQRIESELLLNDPGSRLIVDLRQSAQALEDARRWVDGHCTDDDGGIDVDLRALDEDLDHFTKTLSTQTAFHELDPDDQKRITAQATTNFRVSAGLDRWDVGMAIAAGVAAAVIDAFAVATPNQSAVTTTIRKFARQPNHWLETFAKVPFDQSIFDGFNPNNHRVLTPGHDPLLGLIWGTRDLLAGTMTRTYADGAGLALVARAGHQPVESVARALVIEVAHLMSDVVTSAGLPLPGWTLLPTNPDLAEAAVKAYTDGYDTWHLPAMATPYAVVRGLSYAYWSMRSANDAEFAATTTGGMDSPRMRAIELIGFGIATAADAGQLLAGANPLTTNYVQWLTLARRIAAEAHARSESISEVMISDLTANQLVLNGGWELLTADLPAAGEPAAES